ncbi:BEL1-like homeodomain protein 9 [Vicia villosa]|uniref:BEL1-like homeodomain protein 9 n=1 Tax=Vicia villosa TaxID=3911 RepID=UPI00273BD9A3|nr:BEL1-like homeodomain protein 9 [Vicia villosa]
MRVCWKLHNFNSRIIIIITFIITISFRFTITITSLPSPSLSLSLSTSKPNPSFFPFFVFLYTMAEGFEHYHIPQQSRREKLRFLSQNQPSFIESSSTTLNPSSTPLPSLYDPSFISPVFSPSTNQTIEAITTNPFLYQTYNDGCNTNTNSEVMLLKSEPLSLSLSSSQQNNQVQMSVHHPLEVNNLQRYGSVVVNGGGEVSRNTVPLGPFTGYASVLKGSRFLKPAQQLLDEMCDVGARVEKIASAADLSLMENSVQERNGSVDDGNDVEGRKNKSRLLNVLDEICRRYRQYYQQIHAVITSFEYVAGLGNAAPYASLAINAMTKHFRGLKNVITNQLQFIGKSNFQINNTKDNESPRFCNSDRSPYSRRPEFLEHVQQPIWRPQRGLPERAVSVLRAWLFEHFLHPYPTDTDKLMLAKQTGLSRNQVSNWFINARVRLWKPMVEEIHMLESQQSLKEPSQREEHSRKNLSDNNIAENQSTSTDKFHDDGSYKRMRNELHNIPAAMNQSIASNQQVGSVGVSMMNNGATNNGVSLTLGLHQNHGIGLSEPFDMSAAQRYGLAVQPDSYVASSFQLQNRQFGRDFITGQLLHDFVG